MNEINIIYLYQLLAAPYKKQIDVFTDVAFNAGVANFKPENELHQLLVVTQNSLAPAEGSGGSEGYEYWLERTGFTPEFVSQRELPFWEAALHLEVVLGLMLEVNHEFSYTKHGLRNSVTWKLIRKLANEVLESMDWPSSWDVTMSHTERMARIWPFTDLDE